eukprot:CAMPEP_0197691464 /NCGR_PEP_ID=MMETSP1338-20131121/109760_1 /TAXON_ID=43686 ORGANISM="Pelagodinium beii, Strain RCC1491" /NCGR_SAMPLE_ID=MMETSP1338 /ASSEMBLY_ACC=CAM_ASM_000754 /LENGTH=412 /DNA_ID=CAMNT_0043274015 /DNA_START=111 /DNA_END=1346 /DNA_ORIENTATION=-
MWRRLTGRGRGPSDADTSGTNDRSAAYKEATSSLEELSKALSSGTLASGKEGHLLHCTSSILAVPCGESRDLLLESLKMVLQDTLLLDVESNADWLDKEMSLLQTCFDCKELQGALLGTLKALQRDSRLDDQRALVVAGQAEESNPSLKLARLASGLQACNASEERIQGLLKERRLALHQSEMLLAEPQRAAQHRVEEAKAKSLELEERSGSLGPSEGGSMNEEAVALETEVNRLTERKKELRAQLETVSRQHDDAIARQKAHMSQVDCWRLDKEKVKHTAVMSKLEVEQAIKAASQQKVSCGTFVETLNKILALSSSTEMESLAESCTRDIGQCAELILAATSARLSAAQRRAQKVREEHQRAQKTLDLLAVKGTSDELPTKKELAKELSVLQDAWAAHTTLGCDLKQRAE